MPEVEAPLAGAEVDTSDPSGSAVSILGGIAGFGLLAVIVTYGKRLGNAVTDQVDEATGMNGGGSGDVIMGEF